MKTELTKKCTTSECGYKPISEFYGRRTICKTCTLAKVKDYERTIGGLIIKLYTQMKSKSKTRGHIPPNFTKEDFTKWILDHNNFTILFNNWVGSRYDTKLIPSVDRLNDFKSYTLDNIRLVAWEENRKKASFDQTNGIGTKGLLCKETIQLDLNGNFIKKFASASQAANALDVNKNNITACCNGRLKTSYGFKWKFA